MIALMGQSSPEIGGRHSSAGHDAGELLSPQDSAIRSAPLHTWRTADLITIGKQIAHIAGEWQRAWGLAAETQLPDVRCESLVQVAARGEKLSPTGWQAVEVGFHGVWWTIQSTNDAPVPLLSRTLFGESDGYCQWLKAGATGDTDRSMAEMVANTAWTDWCKRLSQYAAGSVVPQVETRGIPLVPQALLPWSGSLLITLPWCGRSMALLIGKTIADTLIHSSPSKVRAASVAPFGGLVPVPLALASRSTRLQVELKAVEMNLGTLLSLRVGDVVRTSHALDESLVVTHIADDEQGTNPICTGFLGKSDGMRAVELLPAAPSSGAGKASASAASLFKQPPNDSRQA